MKLIFATHNQGKIKEMQALLQDLDIEVLSAAEAGVFEEAREDGKTFAANALKKAAFVTEKTGEWAVADDSGICIDTLGGRPGVLTARWAGEGASDEDLVNYTLKQLKNVPEDERGAYFQSSLALTSPNGEHWIFEGKIYGIIPERPRGKPRPRLPYDVIFIPEAENRTFAEMTDQEKNSLSHRGLAFKKLKEFLSRRRDS